MIETSLVADNKSLAFGGLNTIIHNADLVISQIPFMDMEQIIELRRYAQTLSKQAWRIECACHHEIKQRQHAPKGRGMRDVDGVGIMAAVREAASDAGISTDTVMKNARIHETFFANGNPEILAATHILEKKSYFIEALSADDPITAILKMAEVAGQGELRQKDARSIVNTLNHQSHRHDDDPVYDILYIDPGWCCSEGRKTVDINAMMIGSKAAESSVIFFRVPSARLPYGLRLIEQWGFIFTTTIVVMTAMTIPEFFTRQQHDIVLVAYRGQRLEPDMRYKVNSIEYSYKLEDAIVGMYPHRSYLNVFNSKEIIIPEESHEPLYAVR